MSAALLLLPVLFLMFLVICVGESLVVEDLLDEGEHGCRLLWGSANLVLDLGHYNPVGEES